MTARSQPKFSFLTNCFILKLAELQRIPRSQTRIRVNPGSEPVQPPRMTSFRQV